MLRHVQLRAVADLYDGPHATPAPADGGPVFLGIGNITPDGRLDLSDVRHISEDEFPRWTKRVLPQEGDLVFTYEATLHRYALIPPDFRGCLGRRTALLRLTDSGVHGPFLLYYFLSPTWRQQVERNILPGATVDRIPLTRVPEFTLDLPDLVEQQRIANVMGAYDALIGANEHRMTLLEESVRLLYREWFERLRFPGHEWTATTDGVPDGWRRGRFADVVASVNCRVEPDAVEPTTPYVGLEHMPQRSIALQEWGTATDVASTKLRFGAGNILFGKIRPYFHKVVVAPLDGIASSDALVFRAKEPDAFGVAVAVAASERFVEHASSTGKIGTRMPRADWATMAAYPLLLPPEPIAREFTAYVRARTDLIGRLVLANRKLREARDYLLPRLMSGQLTA